ncbi:hypothetical protein DPMN_132841 [Dreissena polymorpha]|uniref:Uncharacterized protein n=1 Tax=Dreissena polymorpha TaxID=45954 RepID=A0A9D4FVV9_DREPO|nr:hypothetical protein DPMN_132841 [Dreissena polymorpha]
MTEPAMTFLTAEEVAGYVCINYVGKKLDGFEKKLDSFESVVRSVEKQLRRLVACEVLEAVSGDVTVPDAFDVNDAPVSACDVNDNSVVSLSDAVCHDVVSTLVKAVQLLLSLPVSRTPAQKNLIASNNPPVVSCPATTLPSVINNPPVPLPPTTQKLSSPNKRDVLTKLPKTLQYDCGSN